LPVVFTIPTAILRSCEKYPIPISPACFVSLSQWRLQKLAEIGALDKKCIKTISQYSGLASDMLETVITQAALGTLSQLEPAFAELVRQGILGNAVAPSASTGIKQALNMYQKQAKDTLNLVNTVMRYKAKEAYINAVNKAAEIANKQEYLNTLNKATAGAATGSVSRQQALRQCIKEMSEKGIPAFVDKRGREWTPEAYINMDIKTTVSNVAHETQFARMDDYGIDLIEVSSHMGARPRCAPYQGRIYSRSGKNKNYPPWSSTSYGEAAGLLGINCHHKVYPYIEGISIQRYFPYKDEENSKRYKNTQVQRQLERDVRKSKRECAMLNAVGDKEGFSDAALKLKQRQERLKAYCKEKGLSYKPDRTAVEGYNKSVSGKATQAEKKNKENKKHLDFIENDGIIKSSSKLPKKVNLPDEVLKVTVNVDLPIIHGVVPKGAVLTNVYVMAGNKTSTPIRDLKRLYAVYGKDPALWQKKSGDVYAERYKYVVHWYENDGFVPPDEVKLKGVSLL
jgi:hypothetical protein